MPKCIKRLVSKRIKKGEDSMSTELTCEDERLFQKLINHEESIDWLRVAYSFDANSSSGVYLNKAIKLIPKWSDAHFRLRDEVIKCLPDAKQIKYHWLLKALASVLQQKKNEKSIDVESNKD